MKSLPRIIATLGILILAVAGCQKGTQKETAQNTSEAGGAQAGSEAKESDAATRSTTEGKAAPAPVEHSASTLTQPDDGKTVDLHVGQIVTAVLDSNHENGLNWVLLDSKSNVMAQDGTPAYAPSPKMENGKETWRFRAVKPGEETVRMEYRRAMAQHVPERTFRFVATVR
jgi:predicted secreted protein